MRRILVAVALAATLTATVGVTPAQGASSAAGPKVRGWTILSDSDAGADAVIAASRAYRINHLQISHEIVHDLREVRDPAKRAQTNRLTDAAHAAGITEVAVWDHALYDLSYYPSEFRTG